jgi:hypothetical protein
MKDLLRLELVVHPKYSGTKVALLLKVLQSLDILLYLFMSAPYVP